MAELLRYAHVDIAYDERKVVSDVSLSLKEGEILGIVGESGSGKSTLIRAAMGLLGPLGRVTRGEIRFKGVNLPELSPAERRRLNGPELGMVFQSAGASFCPIRTVGSQLFECASEHGRVSKPDFTNRAVELLRRIGLEDGARILNSYPFELSGGMQQRVGIAAAMLMNPSVLFADEPTSALDVSAQRQVVEALMRMRGSFGTAIVIVTHNIGVVGAMADNVLVMRGGAAVEYGPARQVLCAPREAYTKMLMAAVPRLSR